MEKALNRKELEQQKGNQLDLPKDGKQQKDAWCSRAFAEGIRKFLYELVRLWAQCGGPGLHPSLLIVSGSCQNKFGDVAIWGVGCAQRGPEPFVNRGGEIQVDIE